MVQGASQTAGRWPDELRMYKAPPPEVSSEQFYETDPDRGFARGFSIQTVSPMPIGWAEHVLADGHWGGVISGDKVTVEFGSGLDGLKTPIVRSIARYQDLAEGEDKLTCAGSIDSYVRGAVAA